MVPQGPQRGTLGLGQQLGSLPASGQPQTGDVASNSSASLSTPSRTLVTGGQSSLLDVPRSFPTSMSPALLTWGCPKPWPLSPAPSSDLTPAAQSYLTKQHPSLPPHWECDR